MLRRAAIVTFAGALALATGSAAMAQNNEQTKQDKPANQVEQAKQQAEQAKQQAKQQAEQAKEQAKDQAEQAKDQAKEQARQAKQQAKGADAAMFRIEREPLMQSLATWPQASQEVANTFIEQYGLPDEATPTLLIWHDNGPWKRTIVHKEPVEHNFPMPHQDVVEQVISYKVPSPDIADDLARFDGSVYLDRTGGELSAKCDNEAANILALNLADELIKGEKTVEEARTAYAEAIKQSMTESPPKIMSKLQFQPAKAQAAADPDRAIIDKTEMTRKGQPSPQEG